MDGPLNYEGNHLLHNYRHVYFYAYGMSDIRTRSRRESPHRTAVDKGFRSWSAFSFGQETLKSNDWTTGSKNHTVLASIHIYSYVIVMHQIPSVFAINMQKSSAGIDDIGTTALTLELKRLRILLFDVVC